MIAHEVRGQPELHLFLCDHISNCIQAIQPLQMYCQIRTQPPQATLSILQLLKLSSPVLQ